MKIYKSVCIAITNRCTAACKMCCYECSPEKREHLSYETIEDIIYQIKVIGGIENINITGGEPFLYYNDLKRIIEKATQEQLSITCLTNSFWCEDYKKTVKCLRELKNLGLKEIYTSMDVFHREYISPRNVANLLNACKEIGLSCGLNVISVKSRNNELYPILEELGDAIFNVKVTVFPLNIVGEQQEVLHTDDVVAGKKIEELKCRFNRVLLIHYDGNVYPCCSNYINEIPNLRIGNIYENKLNEIILSANHLFPFGKIMRYGLPYIADVVEKNNFLNLDCSYIDGCQLCKTIFSNNEVIEKLKAIL